MLVVSIEQVLEKLESNKNIPIEVGKELDKLIFLFNNKFKEVDLTKLYERIGSLKIIRGNQYIVKGPAQYNINNNAIEFNKAEIVEKYDIENIMMQQLLDIITLKKSSNDEFNAIRKGYRSILTNNLIGNDSDDNLYFDEEVIVNLLGHIVGQETLNNCYFNDDYSPLVNELTKISGNPKEVNEFLNLTNYNLNTKSLNVNSQLGKIQTKMIDFYSKKGNLTEEGIINFERNLLGNSSIIENEKYNSVNIVYGYFKNAIANISIAPQQEPELGKSR